MKFKLLMMLITASLLLNFGIMAGQSHGAPLTNFFPNSDAELDLVSLSSGLTEAVVLSGTSTIISFPDSLGDSNSNGREEIPTELESMSLTGNSILGPATIGVNSIFQSVGLIEEAINDTIGVIDTGSGVDSVFDVYLDIMLGSVHAFNQTPYRLYTRLGGLVPVAGETYECPNTISLFDENGNPTDLAIGTFRFTPGSAVPIPGAVWLLGSPLC
jgi:hypothetical protein